MQLFLQIAILIAYISVYYLETMAMMRHLPIELISPELPSPENGEAPLSLHQDHETLPRVIPDSPHVSLHKLNGVIDGLVHVIRWGDDTIHRNDGFVQKTKDAIHRGGAILHLMHVRYDTAIEQRHLKRKK